MISKLDKSIISSISRDIPLALEPFKDIAVRLGIDEALLLERLCSFKKRGIMRKLSAVLNHRKIGFRFNAMVVWRAPQDFIEKAGKIMASFDEVSHCYQRGEAVAWKYNLYSMIHGRTKKECLDAVKKILNALGQEIDHKILFSSKEEKKVAAKF